MDVPLTIHRPDGASETIMLTCRIDTAEEVGYFKRRRRAALRAAQPWPKRPDAGGTRDPWRRGLPGHAVAMARNNIWANHRLLTACKALTPEEFAAPRTSFFPSLRATLNHILWVDLYYIDALHHDPTVLAGATTTRSRIFPTPATLYDAPDRQRPAAAGLLLSARPTRVSPRGCRLPRPQPHAAAVQRDFHPGTSLPAPGRTIAARPMRCWPAPG